MDASTDATKILEKGPEYLRKQMELESETKGHLSAVERLAASKPKYVKSQEVVNSTQEPVISLGSLSVSSMGSSDQNSGSSVNAVAGDNSTQPAFGGHGRSAGEVRRSSSKKRPDSLLLYRQKCELLRGSGSDRKHHVRRKMLLNSAHRNAPLPEVTNRVCEPAEKEKTVALEGPAKECSSSADVYHPERGRIREEDSTENNAVMRESAGNKSTGLLGIPEIERRSGKGVSRSHSDISSRYSKNFTDFDAFFKYCGLSGELIESLGKENFSARSDEIAIKMRSVSITTSDSGFTRSSGDSDGLLEDDLQAKIRQGTSVVERNARIIKWLYSCKNSKEAGKKLRDLD